MQVALAYRARSPSSSRAGVVAVDTTWVTIAASQTVAQARGGCVEHWRAPGSNAAIAKVRTPVPIESDHTHARTARVRWQYRLMLRSAPHFATNFLGGSTVMIVDGHRCHCIIPSSRKLGLYQAIKSVMIRSPKLHSQTRTPTPARNAAGQPCTQQHSTAPSVSQRRVPEPYYHGVVVVEPLSSCAAQLPLLSGQEPVVSGSHVGMLRSRTFGWPARRL